MGETAPARLSNADLSLSARPDQGAHSPVENKSRPPSKNVPKIPNLLPKENLPVYQEPYHMDLSQAVKDPNISVILLSAGTGTGKTRGGAQIALDALGPEGKMVVTENLRKATEDSARVVAADMNVAVGEEVGVRNRYTHEFSEQTRLLFCPVQSLLVMMEEGDPLLEKYNLIAMDEVHKESKANELAMIRLREIQKQRAKPGKKPLKLMFISATPDKEKITDRFSGTKLVEVPGQTFEIDPHYETSDIPVQDLPKKAAEKVKASIQAGDQGNILVFLSGKRQIDEAAEALKGLTDVDVIPYYSSLTKEQQAKTFAQNSKRKVILATNAAQEGLTLDINVVVDTGMHKHMELDVTSGQQYLDEQKAPQDHLAQRKGRVGRKKSPFPTQPKDKYYALFTESDRDSRPAHEAAEMQRTDLTQEMLILLHQGVTDLHNFDYINKPSPSHIDIALKRLELIGAVKDGKLTERGKFMAQLQLKPNVSSMIYSSIENGAANRATMLAAMLEAYGDALEPKKGASPFLRNPDSDALGLIQLFETYHSEKNEGRRERWAKDHHLEYWKLEDAVKLYEELKHTITAKKPNVDFKADMPGGLDKSILEGFADSLVKRDTVGDYFIESLAVPGIQIGRDSALSGKKPGHFVAIDFDFKSKDGRTARYAKLNHLVPESMITQAMKDESTAAQPPPSASKPLVEEKPSSAKVKEGEGEEKPLPPPPPPKPPTLTQRFKKWISRSILGSIWRWISK